MVPAEFAKAGQSAGAGCKIKFAIGLFNLCQMISWWLVVFPVVAVY
jgi:hypothetical protein